MWDPPDAKSDKECLSMTDVDKSLSVYLFPVFMYDGMPPRAVRPSKRL